MGSRSVHNFSMCKFCGWWWNADLLIGCFLLPLIRLNKICNCNGCRRPAALHFVYFNWSSNWFSVGEDGEIQRFNFHSLLITIIIISSSRVRKTVHMGGTGGRDAMFKQRQRLSSVDDAGVFICVPVNTVHINIRNVYTWLATENNYSPLMGDLLFWKSCFSIRFTGCYVQGSQWTNTFAKLKPRERKCWWSAFVSHTHSPRERQHSHNCCQIISVILMVGRWGGTWTFRYLTKSTLLCVIVLWGWIGLIMSSEYVYPD